MVIVSSVAGLRGGPWEAVYAGTKHAQIGLAGSLDRELREAGIRVTAICPAAVSTEFAIGTGRNEGDAWLEDVLTAEDVAAAIVARLAQPRRLRTQQWVRLRPFRRTTWHGLHPAPEMGPLGGPDDLVGVQAFPRRRENATRILVTNRGQETPGQRGVSAEVALAGFRVSRVDHLGRGGVPGEEVEDAEGVPVALEHPVGAEDPWSCGRPSV